MTAAALKGDASTARPRLRSDLRISRAVRAGDVNYIVKDPLRQEFFRFDAEEWTIIELFSGDHTLEEMELEFRRRHPEHEIDQATLKGYQQHLEKEKLLFTGRKAMNVLLIDKMRADRRSQILSKKGSLLYKRFPIFDPDKLFGTLVPRLGFIWTRTFLWLSLAVIFGAIGLVLANWGEFIVSANELFAFKNLSFANLATLWILIYAIIAIHEVGHGMTCKHYGGEVREIGLLLMFFQPCLYCNVNDAWLFDRKYKQVLVTLAGGYIEFLIGAVAAYVWAFTSPTAAVHVLAFQILTVCSASTVMMNLNPLMKLDGYYLLADATGIANLRQSSFDYVKYIVARYGFRMQVEPIDAPARERRILMIYGSFCFVYVTSMTVGLFYMAQGLLVDHLGGFGVVLSAWVAWKLFGGHVRKMKGLALKFAMEKISALRRRSTKVVGGGVIILLLALGLVRTPYEVPAKVTLEPEFTRLIRPESSGTLVAVPRRDGELVKKGDTLLSLENAVVRFERRIAETRATAAEARARQALAARDPKAAELAAEFSGKRAEAAEKRRLEERLAVTDDAKEPGVASCGDASTRLSSYVTKGTEVCSVIGIETLRARIEFSESELAFVRVGDPVKLRVPGTPFTTYDGTLVRIRPAGRPDPDNPKARLYEGDIALPSVGVLKPGMTGKAKVAGEPISYYGRLARAFAKLVRLDVFF